MFIEVAEIHGYNDGQWVIKATVGGLTYFYTGYEWHLSTGAARLFQDKKSALEAVPFAKSYRVDI